MAKKLIFGSFCNLSLTHKGKRNSETNDIETGEFKKGDFAFLIKLLYHITQEIDMKQKVTLNL